MIRRLTAIIVLGVALSAQIAPLAVASVCRTMPCCGHSSRPAGRPAVESSSCCHLEACEPTARDAGVVPPTVRIEGPTAPVALLLALPCLDRFETDGPIPPLALDRSPDSPVSLHTTLRL
ncbi:MAG TPA: hypothetical protein VN539_05940 [Candidatus Saccharimonadales bacterium]|nr:hypothetical protein [Candidatus Saccharimonadales bacterium]